MAFLDSVFQLKRACDIGYVEPPKMVLLFSTQQQLDNFRAQLMRELGPTCEYILAAPNNLHQFKLGGIDIITGTERA